jgi:hypothetical protein
VFVWTNGDAVWAQVGRDGAPARVGTPVARPSALRVGVLRGALLVVWTGPDGRTPYGHATCTRSDGEARWTFVGGDGPGVTGARAAPLDEESSLEVVAVDGAEALVHRTPRGTHEVRRSRDMLLGRAATGRGARWVPLYEGGAARLLTAPVVWEGPRPAWREDAGPWRGAHTLAVVASGVAGCAPAGAPVLAWSTPDGTYARADGVDVSLAGPGSVGLALAAHAGTVFASWVEGDRARVAACHDGHWARVTESAAVAGTGGDPARERAIDGATLRVDPTPDGAYALTLTEGATPATLLRAERPLRLGEPAGIGRDLWVPVFEDARARLFVQEAP